MVWVVRNGTATDVDNVSLTYTVSGEDADSFNIDSSTGALTFKQAPNFEATPVKNTYSVSVRASDGLLYADQTVTVNVKDVNEAPTVTTPISDITKNTSGAITVNTASHFSDQDAADTSLTYSATLVGGGALPTWLSIDSATGVLSGNPPVGATSVNVRVTATDNGDPALTASDDFAINLSGSLNDTPTVPTFTTPFTNLPTQESPNNIPTLNVTPTGPGDIDPAIVVPAFGDGDGDTLTYSAALVSYTVGDTTTPSTTMPSWLHFDAATRTFSGNPPAGAENTTYTVRVAANDGQGGITTQDIDLVFGTGLNDTPTVPDPLVDPSPKSGVGDMTPVTVPVFSDADGDTLTYSATLTNGDPLPTWLTFDPDTRTFTGNPPAGAGNTTVNVRVTGTDGHGGSVSDDIALAFGTGLNDTPTVPNPLPDPASKSGSGDMSPVVVPAFSDADGDTLTYSATLTNGNPLPTWLTFNPSTRTFTGNPPAGVENTTINVRVTGTDGNGGSVSDDIALAFGTGLNDTPTAPELTDPAIKSGSGDMTPVVIPAFGDADGDVLTYTAALVSYTKGDVTTTSTEMPSWLHFDATTRTFTGNPPVEAENTHFLIRMTASDGHGGTVQREITLRFGTDLAEYVPPPVVTIPSAPSTTITSTIVVVPAEVPAAPTSAFLPPNSVLVAPTFTSAPAVSASVVAPVVDAGRSSANSVTGHAIAGLTAPSAQAFQVVVAARPAGTSDALVINTPLRDTVVDTGARISVTVPVDAFAHTRADAMVTLTATRSNGAALPGWMNFNSRTGTFEGTPPPGFRGEVVVRVVARDNQGREAVQTFKIVVGAGQGQIDRSGGLGQGQAPGRTGMLEILQPELDVLVELINVDAKTTAGEKLQLGRSSLSEQFKKASRPLGSSERLVALRQAIQAASRNV